MSTLGKVFAFIGLVAMVAVCMAAVVFFQQQDNWKKLHDDLDARTRDEIKQLNTKITTLTEDLDKAIKARDDWRTNVDDLRVQVGKKDETIAGLTKDLSDAQANNKRMADDIAKINTELANLRARNVQLTDEKDAALAAKNAAEAAMRKAQDELAAAQDDIRNLNNMLGLTKGELKAALDLIGRYETVYGMEGKRLAESAVKPAPKIDGEVKEADNRAGIILVSVGKGDGVTKGMTFEVIRLAARQYVGRIQVTDVHDEEAVCRILRPMTPNPIQEGDHVTTRLQ